MKKIFYGIKTKNVSSENICNQVNKIPANQESVKCYNFEDGGIWVESNADEKGLKHKLERELNIKLSDPKFEE